MSEEGRDQEIGAYYGELGLTADGDALLYMYDMNPGLQWVIAVEYEDKFEQLPEPMKSIASNMLSEEKVNRYLKGPTKVEAERDGKLVLLENPFTVFVYKKGKRVDWSSLRAAGAGQQAEQAGVPASGNYVWEPLTPEQATLAGKLAKDVSTLAWMVADEVLEAFAEQRGEDELPADMYADMIGAVHRSASYDFAKLWPTVRGSYVTPIAEVDSIEPAVLAVKEAEPENFLATIAEQHPLILDADFAKVLLKSVGETGIKSDPDGRELQARKVFLFIELTSRHGRDKTLAKAIVEQAYDQVPF